VATIYVASPRTESPLLALGIPSGLHTRLKLSVFANLIRWPASRRREQECRAVAEEVLDFLECGIPEVL